MELVYFEEAVYNVPTALALGVPMPMYVSNRYKPKYKCVTVLPDLPEVRSIQFKGKSRPRNCKR